MSENECQECGNGAMVRICGVWFNVASADSDRAKANAVYIWGRDVPSLIAWLRKTYPEYFAETPKPVVNKDVLTFGARMHPAARRHLHANVNDMCGWVSLSRWNQHQDAVKYLLRLLVMGVGLLLWCMTQGDPAEHATRAADGVLLVATIVGAQSCIVFFPPVRHGSSLIMADEREGISVEIGHFRQPCERHGPDDIQTG